MAKSLYEVWDAGNAYEQFMGHWSAEVASRFLAWLDLNASQTWLDVGCGTGALTRAVIDHANPETVVGLDPSLGFVQYASQQTKLSTFVIADGSALPFADHVFDVVISGLALNFMPQPESALAEMCRITKSGGMVAAYIWDYSGQMEFLRYFWDAAVALDAGAKSLHEGYRFPICQPEPLRQLWQAANLKKVTVDAIDIPTKFVSFDAYWQPFTVGNFPAPNYVMSLDDKRRNKLCDYLLRTLPIAEDGSIHLMARAWAVRGVVI